MRTGNLVHYSAKIGGARHIFTDDTALKILLVGGNVPVDRMPTVGNKLPAGTMILFDEVNHDASDIHYSFGMYEAAEAASTQIKVKKIMNNTVAKVGMVIGKIPSTVTGNTTGVTINAIDDSNEEYDLLTLSATLGALTVSDILVEVTATGASAKIKVIPNAMLPYDIDTEAGATMYPVSGIWALMNGFIYERRIPPVATIIKRAMKDNETYPCVFRYTQFK